MYACIIASGPTASLCSPREKRVLVSLEIALDSRLILIRDKIAEERGEGERTTLSLSPSLLFSLSLSLSQSSESCFSSAGTASRLELRKRLWDVSWLVVCGRSWTMQCSGQ